MTTTADVSAAERRALADTLESVGPDAPTLIDAWKASQVAAHVASLDQLAGIPTFVGRIVVARGVRLNDIAGRFAQQPRHHRERFDRNVARLRSDAPWLLNRRSVHTVGLFEVVVHHEDVRRANHLPRRHDVDLDAVIAWLLRYHHKLLTSVRLNVHAGTFRGCAGRGADVLVSGDPLDVLVWLAGRRAAATVDISGPDDALRALAERSLVV